MASADWMKCTTQKAGAMKKHLGQHERVNVNHSNPDIDISKSHLNYTIGCSDYSEALERMKQRTKEVDEVQPPKRVRKDRVTCCMIEIPCPPEIEEQGRADDFFRQAYEVMQKYFGAENVHGGFVHKDEVHEYTDKDGVERKSLEHMHTLVSAYTPEKGINGKAFETRARLRDFNQTLDTMCRETFGVAFNTGEKPGRKSVERLKQERELQEVAAQIKKEIRDLQEQSEKVRKEYDETIDRAVHAMKIPKPPKPPFDCKPTPSVIGTRDQFIRNSVNRDKGYMERRKLEKEVGASYDKSMEEYRQKLEQWEQWEQDFAEYTETYGMSAKVQATAARQVQTEKTQSSREKNLDEREAAIEQEWEKIQQLRQGIEQEVERKAGELYDSKIQEMFGGTPTKREKRLEKFCEKVKYEDGSSVMDAFLEEEEKLKKGKL